MIKAIIWDMDGVLIDSEPHHLEAESKLLKEHGISIDKDIEHKFFGLTINDYFHSVSEHFEKDLPIEDLIQKKDKIIAEKFENQVELMPGVLEVLKFLKQDYKLGLATSTIKKLAEIVLKRHQLFYLFDARVFGDQVKNGKPNPEIYIKALELLDLKPNKVVVIEDSVNGTKAGQRAGMKVIAYKSEHNTHLDLSLADFLIDDLKEIPEILKKINNES